MWCRDRCSGIVAQRADQGMVEIGALNPFLDDRGQSPRILVELTARLFGHRILDRPTRSA